MHLISFDLKATAAADRKDRFVPTSGVCGICRMPLGVGSVAWSRSYGHEVNPLFAAHEALRAVSPNSERRHT